MMKPKKRKRFISEGEPNPPCPLASRLFARLLKEGLGFPSNDPKTGFTGEEGASDVFLVSI